MISAVPAFQDNYIWIIQDSKRQSATVVDPGDATPVIDFLNAHGLRLDAVLITHHHADHCGGLEALLHDAFERNPDQHVAVYGPENKAIAGITTIVKENDKVLLHEGTLRLNVLEVPGHTADHIAYVGTNGENTPVLFCGDTLFAGGCGRLFEGTAEQMWESLQKLTVLPDDTAVYCAHEYTLSNLKFAAHVLPNDPAIAQRLGHVAALRAAQQPTVPSLIGIEKQSNPFLKCRDAVEFSIMRKQKDSFRG